MKPNLALILAISIGLGALPFTTVGSQAVRFGGGHFGGGHFGGVHFGGVHFGGGHFGGRHFGGGHFGGGHFGGRHFGGGHFGGGHFGGRHFAGGHFGGGHFGGSHFAGGRFGGGRFGESNQFAGGRQFGGGIGFNGNAFGTQGGWNGFAGNEITFLDDLAAASAKASAILNASCPSEPPLTPLARLDAVEGRLEATIEAIEIVRPPLVQLYESLSDEQRQRLDAIGAKEARYGSGTAASGSSGATAFASLCGDQAINFTRLPSQRIQEIVKPTGPQESALEDLKQASAKAAAELRASCPSQLAEALVARLDEMTAQLDAMVRAVKSLRPTLATFYASLSDEQKAQFNNMGYSGPPGGKG